MVSKQELKENIETIDFIIRNTKLWEREEDGRIKVDDYWLESLLNVYNAFSFLDNNYYVEIVKELDEVDYVIDLEENTDSYGEHIEWDYNEDNLISNLLGIDEDILKKSKECMNELKKLLRYDKYLQECDCGTFTYKKNIFCKDCKRYLNGD